jgi:elongation factor P--(R)-beta-lysine ligase
VTIDWQPSAEIGQLRMRARLLAKIRDFFQQRDVLEVETPLLCQATGTDPQLSFFSSIFDWGGDPKPLFLQTSPEFAMKRLLAAGSGSIYQICKAFRNGESGRFHNPEFTILEWYRVGFKLPALMLEVATLIEMLLLPKICLQPARMISYQNIFIKKTGLDPLRFEFQEFRNYAYQHNIAEAIDICAKDHALWLDFIFSHHVQPHLGLDALTLVYDYPAIQSSLARINPENPLVAERFEVFLQGVELGNGFFELIDAQEQEQRFDKEIEQRRRLQLPLVNKDQRFLAALQAGLPECSGVAIGLDRVLMLACGATDINQVLSFPVACA